MLPFNASFLESGCDIIPLHNQADFNSDVTSDWVKVRDYQRLSVLVAKYGSEDVDTLGMQFLQAVTNGGSSKGLNVSRYWTKQGTLTSQTVWTPGVLATPISIIGVGSSAPSNGSLITSVDVDTNPFLALIDIAVPEFDASNGYIWFALKGIGAEIDNSCLVSAWAILHGGRFPQNAPLSAIS